MLKVVLHKQRPSYCGPSSLKMLLSYFNIEKSENELGKICKTTFENGTYIKDMERCLASFGFDVTASEYGSWDILNDYINRQRLPVIVDWISVDTGHYSLVVKLTKDHIWIADPEEGRIRQMLWADFNRIWIDFQGEIIQRKEDLLIRWYMVGHPSHELSDIFTSHQKPEQMLKSITTDKSLKKGNKKVIGKKRVILQKKKLARKRTGKR